MKRTLFSLSVVLLVFASCAERRSPGHEAERFLTAYLDCRFADVASMASPRVQEQMRWRASQLTQAEVELLAENEPKVEAESMEEYGDSAVVLLTATDALLLDSIGQPSHIGEAHFRVALKREKGRNWEITALVEIP